MTADTDRTPLTMALYSALHRDRTMALAAAAVVARAWTTSIAVVPCAVPPIIQRTGVMFALYDLGADPDEDVAGRAVAVYDPDGTHRERSS